MRPSEVLFVLVCGVALVNSLFAAVVLAARRKGDAALNRLLALLILTFAVRISKAIAVFFFRDFHPIYEWGWFAMFLGMALILPVYLGRLSRRPRRWAGPAAVAAAAAAAAALTSSKTYPTPDARAFEIVFAAFAVSLAASAALLAARPRPEPASAPGGAERRWAWTVFAFLAAIGALYATYFLPHALQVVPVFNVEAVIFSLAVYTLLFAELRFQILSRVHPGPAPEPTPAERDLLARLVATMERDRPYLDPGLSLPALARSLHATPQAVSRLVNASFRSNFNDYVNRHRVEAAKALLSGPGAEARRMADLAFDCGFNSLSVFYAAFRKFTGRTPSRFLDDVRNG